MSKGKKLVVLLLVVVLLVGAYFAVTHFLKEDPEQEEEAVESIAVGNLKSEDIVEIHYIYGEEDITLVKQDDQWYYSSDKEFPLNQSMALAMVNGTVDLKASRLVSEDGNDFSEYGLLYPSSAITYKLADGKVLSYHIGSYNAFSESYYLNVLDEEKIFLVPSSYVEMFEKGVADLADVEPLKSISTEEVTSVNLVLDGIKTVVFNNPEGLNSVYTDSYTWFSDSTTPLDTDKAVEFAGLAVAFSQKGCADYSADQSDLYEFGFNKPVMTLTVDYTVTEEIDTGKIDENDLPVTETKMTNKVLSLLVGGQHNNGCYYAKCTNSEIVYLIDPEYIDNLRAFDTKTLRYSDVCLLSPDDIESMTLMFGDETAVINISHSTDDQGNPIADYTLNGEVMTAVDFYSVFSSIQSIVSEGICDEEFSEDIPAYITVIYKTNRDGFSQMSLKFVPYDRSFYIVDFNGRRDILVNKRDVENIVSVIDSLKG